MKLNSLRDLPYNTYTVYLLKSEDDVKNYPEGYLFISKVLDMKLLFIDFVDEISTKPEKMVKLEIESEKINKNGGKTREIRQKREVKKSRKAKKSTSV